MSDGDGDADRFDAQLLRRKATTVPKQYGVWQMM